MYLFLGVITPIRVLKHYVLPTHPVYVYAIYRNLIQALTSCIARTQYHEIKITILPEIMTDKLN